MKKRQVSIGLLILVLLLLFSACTGPAGTPTAGTSTEPTQSTDVSVETEETAPVETSGEGGTIKFYVAAPMTGDTASHGLQIQTATQIAVDEINAAGGINGKMLEFEVMDDQANANQAAIVAEKIISDDDALFVLGHNNSGCSLSALPTYEKVNMPVISPTNTSATIVDEGYANYFRIISTDALNGSQLVKLAILELGNSTPALIWENTDYGKGLRDIAIETLEELGVDYVGDESYVAGVDRDYSAQVTKFKGAGADVVLFLGEYTAGALFAKQNISLGLNAEIVGSNGNSNDKLIEIGGADVEGMYTMTSFNPYDTDERIQTFVKAFAAAKNGELPGEWGSHAYDIVYLVKAAIEAGGTTRDLLIEKLHELKAFEGITGTIEFSENGDVPGKKVMVMVVKDGKFEAYKPTKY